MGSGNGKSKCEPFYEAWPDGLAALDILDVVAAGSQAVTMFGVPFHYEMLAGVSSPPA
jgi:hypothetical protein